MPAAVRHRRKQSAPFCGGGGGGWLLWWCRACSEWRCPKQARCARSRRVAPLLVLTFRRPVPCPTVSADISVHELRLQLSSDDPAQLLVVNRKGVILHASTGVASALKDSVAVGGATSSGPRFGGVTGHVGHLGDGTRAHHTIQNSGTGIVFGADLLTGFTLYDFLPAPWKDMHVRFLKDITSSSPPTRSLWSCRKAAPQPTLELRTMTGRPLYMQVSITSGDLNGESTHVIGLQR